jgi:hypothetical protein
VRTEGEVEADAAIAEGEAIDHVSPQVGVGEPAVGEDDGGTATPVEVAKLTVGKVQCLGVSKYRRTPAMVDGSSPPHLLLDLRVGLGHESSPMVVAETEANVGAPASSGTRAARATKLMA